MALLERQKMHAADQVQPVRHKLFRQYEGAMVEYSAQLSQAITLAELASSDKSYRESCTYAKF